MEFPDRSFIKTESREYDASNLMPCIKIENLKYNENSLGKTREPDECNFSSFEEIIIIEVLVELFAKELNRVDQLIKAIKKKNSDLNDSRFFENYIFKKELITNLLQTNDQILKRRFNDLFDASDYLKGVDMAKKIIGDKLEGMFNNATDILYDGYRVNNLNEERRRKCLEKKQDDQFIYQFDGQITTLDGSIKSPYQKMNKFHQSNSNGESEIGNLYFTGNFQENESNTRDREKVSEVQIEKENKSKKSIKYKCTICEKSFIYKTNLTKHIKSHENVKIFKCLTCNKFFNRRQHLENHLRTHSGEKLFHCQLCSKSFIQKHHLDVHLFNHTGEDKKFKCEVCGRTFAFKHSLIEHIRVHTGERPFKCVICEKSFTQKSSLNKHMLMLHNNQNTDTSDDIN